MDSRLAYAPWKPLPGLGHADWARDASSSGRLTFASRTSPTGPQRLRRSDARPASLTRPPGLAFRRSPQVSGNAPPRDMFDPTLCALCGELRLHYPQYLHRAGPCFADGPDRRRGYRARHAQRGDSHLRRGRPPRRRRRRPFQRGARRAPASPQRNHAHLYTHHVGCSPRRLSPSAPYGAGLPASSSSGRKRTSALGPSRPSTAAIAFACRPSARPTKPSLGDYEDPPPRRAALRAWSSTMRIPPLGHALGAPGAGRRSYGVGRVFIASDSPHLMSPTGATPYEHRHPGCVRSRLEAGGHAGRLGRAELLDSYGNERRPVSAQCRGLDRESPDACSRPATASRRRSFADTPQADAIRADYGARSSPRPCGTNVVHERLPSRLSL